MALKKINPVWAVAAAVVIGVAAAAVAHRQALGSRADELAAVEAEIERTVTANAIAEHGLRDLPGLRESVRRFARQVPPDADLSRLLGSVGVEDGAAAPNGAPDREIVTKPTIPGQPVARIPFALQYRGSFRGTVSLLQRLHEGDLFTRVERIVLEKNTGEATQQQQPLRVSIDFSTFARTSKELESWAQAE